MWIWTVVISHRPSENPMIKICVLLVRPVHPIGFSCLEETKWATGQMDAVKDKTSNDWPTRTDETRCHPSPQSIHVLVYQKLESHLALYRTNTSLIPVSTCFVKFSNWNNDFLFGLLTNVAVLLTRICSHLNLPYQVLRSPAAADKTHKTWPTSNEQISQLW